MVKQIEKPASQRRFRALINLVYSDILPDKQGQPLCSMGDITPLYPELLKYPELVQVLIDGGFIEEVTGVEIIRPQNEPTEPNQTKEE